MYVYNNGKVSRLKELPFDVYISKDLCRIINLLIHQGGGERIRYLQYSIPYCIFQKFLGGVINLRGEKSPCSQPPE